MTDEETQRALLAHLSDQSIANLHARLPEMAEVARKEPETWTHRDKMIAWMALSATLGLLYEGKI